MIKPSAFKGKITPRNDNNFYVLLNTLSTLFPEGEQFFVNAVRAYRADLIEKGKLVRGSTLDKDISTFIGHEAYHTHAHAALNEKLYKIGYYDPTRRLRKTLGLVGRNKYIALQATCVLEHYTANLAKIYLEKISSKLDKDTRELWDYHAIEEIDHHHVALDVATLAGGASKTWFIPVSLGLLIAVVTLYVRNGGTLDLEVLSALLDRRLLGYKTSSAEIEEYSWV